MAQGRAASRSYRVAIWCRGTEPPNEHVCVDWRVSGPTGRATPLHVWHDERADRAVITSATEAHMAMVVLTWLHLFTLEQVAGRDIEPTGNRFHQLIAGDREAVHITAAGKWVPRMR